jgi:hypothetical protein
MANKKLQEIDAKYGAPLPPPEQLAIIMQQGKDYYKVFYDIFERYMDDILKAGHVLTKAFYNEACFRFLQYLPAMADKSIPIFYERFIKGKFSPEQEGNVYTFISNLYLQPLVYKISEDYLNKKGLKLFDDRPKAPNAFGLS